jgi:prepilin-type N-terminal cleavage/methylation domain-containing protein
MTVRLRAPQRGLTLMELIICVAIVGVLIALATVAFAEVFRTRGATDRYSARAHTAEWLLRKVADDVRAARGIEAGAAPDSLKVITDAGVVTWRAAKGRIERADAGAAPVALCNAPGLRLRFDIEGPRTVVATIEWEESPRVGVSHPTLSRRATGRRP